MKQCSTCAKTANTDSKASSKGNGSVTKSESDSAYARGYGQKHPKSLDYDSDTPPIPSGSPGEPGEPGEETGLTVQEEKESTVNEEKKQPWYFIGKPVKISLGSN